MSTLIKSKRYRALKIFAIIFSVLIVLPVLLYIFAVTHTQVIVGFIQSQVYGDVPINSFEPLYPPVDGVKADGQYKISEINYGNEYPNSFLDITYPDENVQADRPTLIYFHGGGFFSGSKNMGDPMAASDATALIDDLCAQGFNIVNIDYALVPDYRFPIPLIQANQAFEYLMAHCEEYHLNMDDVIIMGSSAGAIMASQLGSIITNPEYSSLLNITCVLTPNQVKAIILDDAPLDYENFTLNGKILIGNYVKGSIFLSDDEISRYNNIFHLTSEYPPTFLLGSEYRHDMNLMHEHLDKLNVMNELVDPYAENGETRLHCFIANERVDPIAKNAFDRLISFLNSKIE